MTVSAKVATRISAGLKKFQPILASAKSRDVNESDTVIVVMDMLQEIFGYDKYSEITSEHSIKGTFCDLAIKLENSLSLLIEVKAIGLELKDNHLKQAVDYAANQGVEWVVLTNGQRWRVYKVIFAKPIDHELVVEFAIPDLNPRTDDHIDLVGLLSKEGWQKARIGEYHSQRQALNRFFLGAVVLSDAVVDVVRRELKRMSPGVKIEVGEIRAVLEQDVIKREVIEGDKADAARKQIGRAANRALRAKGSKSTPEDVVPVGVPVSVVTPIVAAEKPEALD
jgi:hypothetical protein